MRQKQIQNNTLVVVCAMSVISACAAFWYVSAAVVEQKQQPLPLSPSAVAVLPPSPPAAATTQKYTRRKQPPSYSTAALKLGVLALAASSRIASPTTSTFTPTTYAPLASTPASTRANRTVTAHSTYTPTPATTFDTRANRMVTAPLAPTYSIPLAPAPAPAPVPVRGVPTHRVTALAMSRRAPVDNNHHPHTSPTHSVASNRFTFGPTIQPADWSTTTEQIFRKFDDYTMYQFVTKYCRQKDYATPEEKYEFIKLHKLTLNRPNIKRESPPPS